MNTFLEALYFLHIEIMANLDHYNSIELKGVKKVRSAIKLCSHYFSYNVSNNIVATGILLSRLTYKK